MKSPKTKKIGVIAYFFSPFHPTKIFFWFPSTFNGTVNGSIKIYISSRKKQSYGDVDGNNKKVMALGGEEKTNATKTIITAAGRG